MEISLEAKVVLTVEHKQGSPRAKHVATSFNLIVPSNLDRSMYIDNQGTVTSIGSQALTNILTQGLIANLHLGHEKNWRDSAEHLRFIISELERGFVEVPYLERNEFPESEKHRDGGVNL